MSSGASASGPGGEIWVACVLARGPGGAECLWLCGGYSEAEAVGNILRDIPHGWATVVKHSQRIATARDRDVIAPPTLSSPIDGGTR